MVFLDGYEYTDSMCKLSFQEKKVFKEKLIILDCMHFLETRLLKQMTHLHWMLKFLQTYVFLLIIKFNHDFLTLNEYFYFKIQNNLNIHMIISFNSKLTGYTFTSINMKSKLTIF